MIAVIGTRYQQQQGPALEANCKLHWHGKIESSGDDLKAQKGLQRGRGEVHGKRLPVAMVEDVNQNSGP